MEKTEPNKFREVKKGNVSFKIERHFGKKSVQQILTEKLSNSKI